VLEASGPVVTFGVAAVVAASGFASGALELAASFTSTTALPSVAETLWPRAIHGDTAIAKTTTPAACKILRFVPFIEFPSFLLSASRSA
jgi:hypothetical protein